MEDRQLDFGFIPLGEVAQAVESKARYRRERRNKERERLGPDPELAGRENGAGSDLAVGYRVRPKL